MDPDIRALIVAEADQKQAALLAFLEDEDSVAEALVFSLRDALERLYAHGLDRTSAVLLLQSFVANVEAHTRESA